MAPCTAQTHTKFLQHRYLPPLYRLIRTQTGSEIRNPDTNQIQGTYWASIPAGPRLLKGNDLKNIYTKTACALALGLLSVSAMADCTGYTGPGGPCSTGPGGGLSTGPGGGLSTGPGGGLSTGPGGGLSTGPGGGLSTGPGGGMSTGPGGGLSTGPGGGMSTGPGGGMSTGPGGGQSNGPGNPWRTIRVPQ